MKVVPYIRTSTDDKGQDPGRQNDVMLSWSRANNVSLADPVIDEGTSGYKFPDPFERHTFLDAVQVAVAYKADGVPVESHDRFTRGGPAAFFLARARLQKEHGLKLFAADISLAEQEGTMGDLWASIRSVIAHSESKRKSEAVRSGMHRKMRAGMKMGRPPKPFTDSELSLALNMRNEAAGIGWERIAHEINRRRGVYELVSLSAQRDRKTSGQSVKRAVHAYQTAPQKSSPAKVEPASEATYA